MVTNTERTIQRLLKYAARHGADEKRQTAFRKYLQRTTSDASEGEAVELLRVAFKDFPYWRALLIAEKIPSMRPSKIQFPGAKSFTPTEFNLSSTVAGKYLSTHFDTRQKPHVFPDFVKHDLPHEDSLAFLQNPSQRRAILRKHKLRKFVR